MASAHSVPLGISKRFLQQRVFDVPLGTCPVWLGWPLKANCSWTGKWKLAVAGDPGVDRNALASLSSIQLNVQVWREQPRLGVAALKVLCPQEANAVARNGG
jgi:hypothetical protein